MLWRFCVVQQPCSRRKSQRTRCGTQIRSIVDLKERLGFVPEPPFVFGPDGSVVSRRNRYSKLNSPSSPKKNSVRSRKVSSVSWSARGTVVRRLNHCFAAPLMFFRGLGISGVDVDVGREDTRGTVVYNKEAPISCS